MAYLVISSPFLDCLITIPFVLGGYFDIDNIFGYGAFINVITLLRLSYNDTFRLKRVF